MSNPFSLEGRNVLVTGAAQGVGREVARTVVSMGGRAAVVDLNKEGIDSLVAELGDDKAMGFHGSVTDQGLADGIVEAMVGEWGSITGLVNNAGIVRAAMIHKMSREYWDEVINVNLTAVYLVLQSVGRQMIKQSETGEFGVCPGQIVNVSSIAGTAGTIGQINYGAAKAGVLGITMSAARGMGALRHLREFGGVRHGRHADDGSDPGAEIRCPDHGPHTARPLRRDQRRGAQRLLPACAGGQLHHRQEPDHRRRHDRDVRRRDGPVLDRTLAELPVRAGQPCPHGEEGVPGGRGRGDPGP